MPITVPEGLPAIKTLTGENIFVMTEGRARSQDIRPLRILILNLMPTKTETETQLLRLIGNTPLQVEIELMQAGTHTAKNVSAEYLLRFYKTLSEVRGSLYDGLIVTGAPVEQMAFEDVDYWEELCEIFDWSRRSVFSTLHICWGAQAGLYFHYGVDKHPLPEKLSGVYEHRLLLPTHPMVRGFDEVFYAPHSRYTGVRAADIEKIPALELLAASGEAGVYLAAEKGGRRVFVTGHSEYDRDTLAREYRRDVGRGLDIRPPRNYYPGDDPEKAPVVRWRGHASLLFANWLNYCVYQQTPYDLAELRRPEVLGAGTYARACLR